jgi:predicted RNase H-like HicB family nuclease
MRTIPMGRLIVVKATWDPEANVFVAESGDVPGLVTEAESIKALVAKLPGLIQDLLEVDGAETEEIEVPIEIVAHASMRVRLSRAA